MKKIYSLLLLLCCAMISQAQVNYTANGGSSFGGPIGNSTMTINHDATNITITIDRDGDLTSNNMVMYIDTGVTGRTVINGDVNDDGDGGRKAVSKFGSGDLNFPPGFEASYAIYGDSGFMGMFGIPATGTVGTNALNFITGVGNATADPFVLTLSWAQLGLTSTDSFSFVVTYGNPNDPSGNMFSSNEGYGDGIFNGGNNIAFGPMTYTTYYEYPSGDKHGVATTSGVGVPLWSLDSTWVNGNPPSSDDQIIIAHNTAVDVDVIVNESLTVNPGITVGVFSTNVFTLNGTLTTNSPLGRFGFNSDANGTAQFLNGPSAVLNGEVVSGRFIPTGSTSPRRAFRFISSPVNSTTNIYENWQTGGLSVAGIGTQITGSTTGANGFDATSTGNPSLFFYAENPDPMISTYNFQSVSATNTAGPAGYLKAGQAFNLFVRGDRNYDLSTAPATPNVDVIIPTLGSLEMGSVNTGALNPNAGGFSFIGNPYQATVNMSTVTKNNVNPNFIYIWNSNAATRGAYETIAITGTGTLSDKRFIQPGQAFFMQTVAAGAASLDFNLSDKATAQNNVGPFSTPNNRPLIELSLYRDLDGVSTIFDELSIFLDGNNSLDLNDAAKIENFEESFSRNLNGNLLSLENRAMPTHNEIIPLDFKNIAANAYTLNIDINSLTTGMEAILHDKFLNTDTILVDGMNTVNLSFDLNDPASIDVSRFELKFINSTLSTDQIGSFTFKMFPNPSINGQVILAGDFSQEKTTATFYNTLGQQVFKTVIKTNEENVNIQNLDAGIYLVNVVSGNQSITQKLVIK